MLAGPLGLVGRAGEIEVQAVAAFLGDHVDAHRLFQRDAVVVDETLGFVAAVGPFGDGGAHPRFADLE